MKSQSNGYILHESPTVVAIATLKSSNRKTGNMVQVWILNRNESPLAALKSGADKEVCGMCKHRPNGNGKRSCYVDVGRAPEGVWKAYQRGRYEYLTPDKYGKVFFGRRIRFGAYGDPAFVPVKIWTALKNSVDGHTSYTHNWKRDASLKRLSMASVDSVEEYNQARSLGWRTFRVSVDAKTLPGEIMCPASAEAGHKTTCEMCCLCNGATSDGDKRKSIMIKVHGTGKNNFVNIRGV